MMSTIVEIYNTIAGLPIAVTIVLLVAFVLFWRVGLERIPGLISGIIDFTDFLPNTATPTKASKDANKLIWSYIWHVLQVIAVIVTIIGFGLQIGIYFGLFPEMLELVDQ